jgi:hypothetical protein
MKIRFALPLPALALALAACGGGAPAAKPAPAADEERPAQMLIDALQKRGKEGPNPGDAVVTFAVFSPETPPVDPEQRAVVLNGIVEATFNTPPADLADPVKRVRGRPPLVVTVQPVEALPLNVEALAAMAGPADAQALRAAKTAIFVRYLGKPAPDAAHLRGVGVAASALAADAKGVVTDLGTLRTWSSDEFRARIQQPDWVSDEVTIEASQDETGSVVFFTRGMAKLGLPDLEQAGVPPAAARDTFAGFQRTWAALREHGHAAPGDRLGEALLQTCKRPALEYDHECVGLAPPQ